jgi:hypothetical protein
MPFLPEELRRFIYYFLQLRDIWATQIANSSSGVARVEVLSWLSKATLDIIGLAGALPSSASFSCLLNSPFSCVSSTHAGFNYTIDALDAPEGAAPNELAEAFEALFASETGFSLARFLQLRFPLLRRIVRPSLPSLLPFPLPSSPSSSYDSNLTN